MGYPTIAYTNQKFPATLSDSIGQLTGLVELTLKSLWLASSFLRSFSQLKQMRSLDLSYNYFASPLPVIFNLPKLTNVNAVQNFFSGGLPQRPAAYTTAMLSFVNLAINRLSGPIPAALATLPSLETLTLYVNRLS
ncbi:unnamed protein product, partial [Closterium sp. NIES-54]